MSTEELVKYVSDNNLEYQAINMVMFNEIGFSFIPVENPTIDRVDGTLGFMGNGYNMLSSGEHTQFFFPDPFLFADDYMSENYRKFLGVINKMCSHKEHVYAYVARTKDEVWGSYIYNRKSDGIKKIRNEILADFIEYANITTVKELNEYISKALEIKKNKYQKANLKNMLNKCSLNCTKPHLLIDDLFLKSVKKVDDIDSENFKAAYWGRIAEAEVDVFNNRSFPIGHTYHMLHDDIGNVIGIGFQVRYISPPSIKTDLSKDMVIVSREDKISDILCSIVLKMDKNEIQFKVATGYVYESGINLLEPIYQMLGSRVLAGLGVSKMELIIGALQKYDGNRKVKELNYATAEKINAMIETGYLDDVYTYPNSFYHGKYYYISNGEESYVITGSSNVTESAFCNNFELDVLYHFKREKGIVCEMEQAFIDWYDKLKSECISFTELNSNLFPRNIYADEKGTVPNDSLRKELSDPEEQERYDFLMSYNPAKIDRAFLKRRRDMRPFKGYIIFEYPQYNITILESFKFGNACYIFGTCDIHKIESILQGKTKEAVKESELYLTHIEHTEVYKDELKYVFNNNGK